MTTRATRSQVHLDNAQPATPAGEDLALRVWGTLARYGLSPAPWRARTTRAVLDGGPGVYVAVDGDDVLVVWHAGGDDGGMITDPLLRTVEDLLNAEGDSPEPLFSAYTPDVTDVPMIVVQEAS